MKNKSKKRMPLIKVTETIKEQIQSQEFLDSARQKAEYFTRKRKMPFTKLVVFMLNMLKSSIQVCLDNFLEKTGAEEIHMKQQSFSEARQKIRWQAFQSLFKTIVNSIYEYYFDTWHGYRLMAVDGTKIQLPNEQKLREHFGTMGKNNAATTGQGSALYDVLNNVLIDAQLAPLKTDERTLALQHLEALSKMTSFNKECVLYDRGYPSFELIETHKRYNIGFVMRVKKGFNKSIDQLIEGDHIATLQKRGHDDITVRVIKFTLSSGEEETLITSITDKRMGIEAFKKLYFMRWPIETKYDEIKNKLEVENFSGLTCEAIMQDFFITMYMSNIAAVACWEAQIDVDGERELKNNKFKYHVNVNNAIGALKDRFILAVLEENPRLQRKKVNRILLLLSKSVTPTRPERSAPRNSSPRKAKHQHNRKSNC
jgi:hypothetical protein